MKKLIILIVSAAVVFGLVSLVDAAPTSTPMQNLFITALSGSGTKCLHIINSGLVGLATDDCGTGGAASGTFTNVYAGGILSVATGTASATVSLSTSTLWLQFSGVAPVSFNTSTGAVSFVNPGFVTSASSVTWTALQTFTVGATFNSTATFNSSTVIANVTSSILSTDSTGKIVATTTAPGGVTSVNSITGGVIIAGGSGITVSSSSQTITVTGTGGTVTTGTVNTAPQVAVGLGGTAIGFYSGLTFTSSTGVLAVPTGTFSGNVSVGTTTPNGLLNIVNASNTVALNVATTTGATSSFVSLNVKGNASTSAAQPVSIFQIFGSGHINSTGTIPTVSSCGAGSPSVKGSDSMGAITLGTGGISSCKLTFQIPYETSNVICMATDSSSTDAVEVTSVSSSSATFGFAVSIAGGSVYYMCGENM